MRLILVRTPAALLAGALAALGLGLPIAPAAAGDRVTVVASFFPLAEAAGRVGGDAVRVRNLTPPGVEPHDLELTTDDRDAIEDAGLVVVLGERFQPAIEEATDDRDGPTVQVLHEIGVRRRAARRDPHVWLDPVLMGRIVDAVARALAKAEPGRRDQLKAQARAFRDQLDALDAEYRAGLADCDRDLLVTAHEAFGWLARRYGLRQEGVAGVDPEAEPDPERIADLADLVRREGVTTIFTEELVSPDVADTLAREAGGVGTEVLSPLEGLTARQRARGDDYVSVMRDNLAKLRIALACR
jgi:zinc transport system substrate-binding protein